MVADPQEKNNLAPQQTATVAVLEDKLQALLRQNPFKPGEGGTSGLSPDALEKLRALGYVAYRSPVSPEALAAGLPDPKSKLWEFNAILEAADAFQAGDVDRGKGLLAKVRESDPGMYVVSFMLGENALRRQAWDEAATELQKCLELNPNFDQAMAALARALLNLGRIGRSQGMAGQGAEVQSAELPRLVRAWIHRIEDGQGRCHCRHGKSGLHPAKFCLAAARSRHAAISTAELRGGGETSGQSGRVGSGRCAPLQFSGHLAEPDRTIAEGSWQL